MTTVLVLGPSLNAVSGVSTHVRSLLESELGSLYSLLHHEVGSEGRRESAFRRMRRLASGPFSLAAAILRHEAAIVHINWSLNAKAYWRDLAHLVVARLCGAQVVLQKHGGHLSQFARNPLFAALVRATLRLADALVVLSQAELEEFRAFAPGHLVAAVPNGVDPRPYELRERDAQPGAPLEVLYSGRLASHKGVLEAIEALALARVHDVWPRLTIAGGGPEEARLRARVRALGLEDQVRFVGAVSATERARLLCRADALVLASYTEGLPYSLLEAMAAGAVPIVTAVGAVPEVVSEGVHGFFVPMKDAAAIARVLRVLDRDRAQLELMRQACRSRIAAGFTLERLAQSFHALYAGLLPLPTKATGSEQMP